MKSPWEVLKRESRLKLRPVRDVGLIIRANKSRAI